MTNIIVQEPDLLVVSVDTCGHLSITVRDPYGAVWVPLERAADVTSLFVYDNKRGWLANRIWYTLRVHEDGTLEAIELDELSHLATAARVVLSSAAKAKLFDAMADLQIEYKKRRVNERREMLEKQIADDRAELEAIGDD